MSIGELYPAILSLVLAGILLGVGLTVLGNLSTSTGVTNAGAQAINTSITAIGGFATWMTVIVVIVAAAIIIGLVVRSFSGGKM